jgi:hypothetical protein
VGVSFCSSFRETWLRLHVLSKKPFYGIEEDLGVQGEAKSSAVIDSCYKRRQPLPKTYQLAGVGEDEI